MTHHCNVHVKVSDGPGAEQCEMLFDPFGDTGVALLAASPRTEQNAASGAPALKQTKFSIEKQKTEQQKMKYKKLQVLVAMINSVAVVTNWLGLRDVFTCENE